uniref:Zinc finger and BTB domain containing 33 n=1 Tax=Leptobrachium leishanense TaxID=445787 RepID=A0A8C5Q156_9ANUR
MDTKKLITATDTQYSGSLLQALNDQRMQGLFCDVTVIVEDRKFRAHKNILSACSTYFHQLFCLAGQVVELNFVRADIFAEILNYIYTAKIVRVKCDMLDELIKSGQLLGVPFIADLGIPLSHVKNISVQEMDAKKVITATDKQYSGSLLQALNDQRMQGLFCDVTIIIEDRKFRAHKNILSACSSYFYQLFCVSGQVVELNFVKADIFAEILNYIYTAKIVCVKQDMFEDLIRSGQLLGVPFIAELGIPMSYVRSMAGDGNDSSGDDLSIADLNKPEFQKYSVRQSASKNTDMPVITKESSSSREEAKAKKKGLDSKKEDSENVTCSKMSTEEPTSSSKMEVVQRPTSPNNPYFNSEKPTKCTDDHSVQSCKPSDLSVQNTQPPIQNTQSTSSPVQTTQPTTLPVQNTQPATPPVKNTLSTTPPTQNTLSTTTPVQSIRPSTPPAQSTRPPTPPAQSTQLPTPPAQSTRPPTPSAQSTGPPTLPAQSTGPPTLPVQSTGPPTPPAQSTRPPTPPAQSTPPSTLPAQSTPPPPLPAQNTLPSTSATENTQPPTPPAQNTQPPTPPAQNTQPPTPPAQNTQPPTPPVQNTPLTSQPVQNPQPLQPLVQSIQLPNLPLRNSLYFIHPDQNKQPSILLPMSINTNMVAHHSNAPLVASGENKISLSAMAQNPTSLTSPTSASSQGPIIRPANLEFPKLIQSGNFLPKTEIKLGGHRISVPVSNVTQNKTISVDGSGVQRKPVMPFSQNFSKPDELKMKHSDAASGSRMDGKKIITLGKTSEIGGLSTGCKVYANIGEDTYDIVIPIKDEPDEGLSKTDDDGFPNQKRMKMKDDDHYELIVDGRVYYICIVCKRSYVCLKSLRRHFNVHSWEKKYPCRYCERVFPLAEYRTKHEINHTGERRYQCLTCGSTFRNYHLTSSHIKSVHSLDPSGDSKLYRLNPCKTLQLRHPGYVTDPPNNAPVVSDGGIVYDIDPDKPQPASEETTSAPTAAPKPVNWDSIFLHQNNRNVSDSSTEFEFIIPESY